VPSGPPRRKFPLIRIVLLLALGVLVYAKFDDVWNSVRSVANPVTLWNKMTGSADAASSGALGGKSGRLVWSTDSSLVSLACTRGLSADCCDQLNHADKGLCQASKALLEKARWKGALTQNAADRPLHIEARAVVGDLGEWGYELSGLSGRDGIGPFTFRRLSTSQAWCDTRRGCLRTTLARAPLLEGHLVHAAGNGSSETVRAGTTFVKWASGSPRVRAVLPGRVAKVASQGADTTAVTVMVYHGAELYVTYGPLRPVAGVKAGALVKAGSYLGDARGTTADGSYALNVGLRQAGQPVDAAAFWGLPDFGYESPTVSATSTDAVTESTP
jgi:Peptidase family M23